MHDIWNPWHGCVKVSEGCKNCYMYALDKARGQDGRRIYRTADRTIPIQRDRQGNFKYRPGEFIRVCMTSDFFLEDADAWREEAWAVMRERRDLKFYLLTKRAERITRCLPVDWGGGWENVMLSVTAENQKRADERLPQLLAVPAKHRGISCAPLLGPVSLAPYLAAARFDQVTAGGENYGGERPCHWEWVQQLSQECRTTDTTFAFLETGTVFVKDGRTYRLPGKTLQTKMAYRSQASYEGRRLSWHLTDGLGLEIPESDRHHPVFDGPNCAECAGKLICNGCSHCGLCGMSS